MEGNLRKLADASGEGDSERESSEDLEAINQSPCPNSRQSEADTKDLICQSDV